MFIIEAGSTRETRRDSMAIFWEWRPRRLKGRRKQDAPERPCNGMQKPYRDTGKRRRKAR
jgi:hypothetical protein